MHIAVIGLGVLGASVARSLSMTGPRSPCTNGTPRGAGTSGTSFAWINSHDKDPVADHKLNVAGMADSPPNPALVHSGSAAPAIWRGPGTRRGAHDSARRC